MMTLAEMADLITSKVRQTDEEALADCKTFIGRRYEMIYNDQLWKDSIFGLDFTLPITGTISGTTPNTTAQAAAGIWFLPTVCDLVLAVRSTEGPVEVIDEGSLYQVDLDAYDEVGNPVQFVTMAPAVAMRLTASQFTLKWTGGANDNGTLVRCAYVTEGLAKRVRKIAVTEAGVNLEDTEAGIVLIESVSKPTTTYPLSLVDQGASPVATLTAAAAETEIPQRKRIRVFPAPNKETVCKCLVKAMITPLDYDNARPGLRGVENILLALAHGDMLQRGRQYGKAQLLVGEGTALLEQYKKTETLQRANNARIVPRVDDPAGQSEYLTGKGIW